MNIRTLQHLRKLQRCLQMLSHLEKDFPGHITRHNYITYIHPRHLMGTFLLEHYDHRSPTIYAMTQVTSYVLAPPTSLYVPTFMLASFALSSDKDTNIHRIPSPANTQSHNTPLGTATLPMATLACMQQAGRPQELFSEPRVDQHFVLNFFN